MNSHDLHVRKMKSRNDKWGSIYIPDIPIVDPDVTVYDMAEIRRKLSDGTEIDATFYPKYIQRLL